MFSISLTPSITALHLPIAHNCYRKFLFNWIGYRQKVTITTNSRITITQNTRHDTANNASIREQNTNRLRPAINRNWTFKTDTARGVCDASRRLQQRRPRTVATAIDCLLWQTGGLYVFLDMRILFTELISEWIPREIMLSVAYGMVWH